MRQRAGWMNTATDPVLELLRDSGLSLPPGAIHYNISRQMDVSRASVTRAIRELQDHGLIEKAPDSKTYYEITELGKRYLDGELDASDL